MSKIIESLRGDLAALHEAGAISKVTMRQFDAICPAPVREFEAADIKRLRDSLKFSQPVFALHLHTTASTVRKWEQGETRPAGPALCCSMSSRTRGCRLFSDGLRCRVAAGRWLATVNEAYRRWQGWGRIGPSTGQVQAGRSAFSRFSSASCRMNTGMQMARPISPLIRPGMMVSSAPTVHSQRSQLSCRPACSARRPPTAAPGRPCSRPGSRRSRTR